MKWDYFTYLNQPTWFLDALKLVNNIDAEHQNKLSKRMKK